MEQMGRKRIAPGMHYSHSISCSAGYIVLVLEVLWDMVQLLVLILLAASSAADKLLSTCVGSSISTMNRIYCSA